MLSENLRYRRDGCAGSTRIYDVLAGRRSRHSGWCGSARPPFGVALKTPLARAQAGGTCRLRGAFRMAELRAEQEKWVRPLITVSAVVATNSYQHMRSTNMSPGASC